MYYIHRITEAILYAIHGQRRISLCAYVLVCIRVVSILLVCTSGATTTTYTIVVLCVLLQPSVYAWRFLGVCIGTHAQHLLTHSITSAYATHNSTPYLPLPLTHTVYSQDTRGGIMYWCSPQYTRAMSIIYTTHAQDACLYYTCVLQTPEAVKGWNNTRCGVWRPYLAQDILQIALGKQLRQPRQQHKCRSTFGAIPYTILHHYVQVCTPLYQVYVHVYDTLCINTAPKVVHKVVPIYAMHLGGV